MSQNNWASTAGREDKIHKSYFPFSKQSHGHKLCACTRVEIYLAAKKGPTPEGLENNLFAYSVEHLSK